MHNFASWLPAAITQMSQRVDSLFYIMLSIIAFFFVLVEALLITLLLRYRRTRKNRTDKNVYGHNAFEIIWTLIPTAILIFMGVISVKYVYAEQTPSAMSGANTIRVVAHMWQGEFTCSSKLNISSPPRERNFDEIPIVTENPHTPYDDPGFEDGPNAAPAGA